MSPLRAMGFGAAVACAGILVGATGSGTAGAIVTLAGWLMLVWGLHRFGRSGADT